MNLLIVMENELNNEAIERAISELGAFLGVKEPISGKDIFALIRSGEVKEAIQLIARQLDLPVSINIVVVPNNYREQNNTARFHSTQLVKSKRHGVANEGITAQVLIPPNLPFYGTQALTDYPITVKISQNCTNQPVAFVTVMAHELSHVLLHSLMYAKKDDEFYTDLTAIMLGFASIFKEGRKIVKVTEEYNIAGTTTTTQTTTYGYLNDTQFSFAYNKVFWLLKRCRSEVCLVSDELHRFKRLSEKHNEVIFKFRRYFKYLIANKDKIKTSEEDGKAIGEFFQDGFVDRFASAALGYSKDCATIQSFLDNLEHYTEQNSKTLQAHVDTIKSYCGSLNASTSDLRSHVQVLSQHIDYVYRFKTFFSRPEEKQVVACGSCGQLLRLSPGSATVRCPRCKTVISSTKPEAATVAGNSRETSIIAKFKRVEKRELLLALGAFALLCVFAWGLAGQHSKRFSGQGEASSNGVEGIVGNAINSPAAQGMSLKPLPDNGAVRVFTVSDRIAPFKIIAGPSGHSLVKLLKSNSKMEVMTIFVRSGQVAEVKVPLGSYDIRLASGNDWYGYAGKFGRFGSYRKSDQVFTFDTDGNYVGGHSITLSDTLNGNMRTQGISADEF